MASHLEPAFLLQSLSVMERVCRNNGILEMSHSGPEWANALNDCLSLAKRVARQVEAARFLGEDDWERFMDVICSELKDSEMLPETLYILNASLQCGSVLPSLSTSNEFLDCFLAVAQLAEMLENDHRSGSHLGEVLWKELRAIVRMNDPVLQVLKAIPLPVRSSTIQTYSSAYKEKLLNMPLKEKRKLYACKSKFHMLESIPTWTDFASRNGVTAEEDPLYPVHGDMNEKISLFMGDITTLEIDAIVNSTNTEIFPGGGVDGAINRAAGPALARESLALKGIETGSAKITGGYLLPAKYVIQAVGPIGKNPKKLRSSYKHCLKLLVENGLRTIAFPCISTGIYAYPNRSAAMTALKTVREFLLKGDHLRRVDRIIFCVFLSVDFLIYKELLPIYFPT